MYPESIYGREESPDFSRLSFCKLIGSPASGCHLKFFPSTFIFLLFFAKNGRENRHLCKN